VQKDLESLISQAPETIADVGKTIARAIELEATLSARHGVRLRLEDVHPHLMAAAHPSALRQVLIMAIGQLTRHTSSGEIAIRAARSGGQVEIELSTAVVAGRDLPDVRLIHEMLASQRGRLLINGTDRQIAFRILLPAAGRITVLVVDDNLDQVHFYRRCVSGTRYHIVHAPYGQRTVQAIAAAEPQVIVLDILLPEVDGWELLSELQEHPATRSIPVIICSIIEEEELASALGAALYLPKPIHHRAFIEALAQVVDPTSVEATKSQGRSAKGH
jgi:CheY-like chemotaxis protein